MIKLLTVTRICNCDHDHSHAFASYDIIVWFYQPVIHATLTHGPSILKVNVIEFSDYCATHQRATSRVCPSRSCIDSKRLQISSNCFLISRSGFPIILVSWGHPMLPNSKGNPSAGELNTWGKFVISTVIAVYLGNGTRSAIVAMER